MIPPFPEHFEYILNSEFDKLDTEQRDWYFMLCTVDAIFYTIGQFGKSRLQTKYGNVKLSDVICECAKLASPCDKDGAFIADKTVMLAADSFHAVNKIIRSPKTKLAKESCLLHISKLGAIYPRTVEWLSQKPGETLAEKIKPSDKVFSARTVFTTDTKENRLFVYYCRRMFAYMGAMLDKSACGKCERYETCEAGSIKLVREFMRAKNRIRQSELSDVPPEAAAVPNNALMCDKYYKRIWDSYLQYRRFESNVRSLWDRLEDYFANLDLLLTATEIYCADPNAILIDKIVRYEPNVGYVVADKSDKPEKQLDSIAFVKGDRIVKVEVRSGKTPVYGV